jgi:hypothetical protein
MSRFVLSICYLVTVACLLARADHHEDDHDHDHDHDHDDDMVDCACAVTMNCSDSQAMLSAVAVLEASCKTSCASSACIASFFLVQGHHDYCANKLPDTVEDALHEFEDGCTGCHIDRIFDSSLPKCPSYDCSSTTIADAAIQTLTDNDCADDCSSSTCVDAYRVIRGSHDTCDHDDLSEAVEDGIHDFEEICEAAECNVDTEERSTPTCSAMSAYGSVAAVLASLAVFGIVLG